MAEIRPLPAEVAAQIRSSHSITCLSDVVLGLLKNSLDARASQIEISVDFRLGGCASVDNGHGIVPEDFADEGGLGCPYSELIPIKDASF